MHLENHWNVQLKTGLLKPSARRTTQLLKLRHYKTVIHALQNRGPASRVHFCSWFLQCVIEDEIDLNPCDFFVWGCLKDKVCNSSPQMEEELKENIHREIENIPAERLPRVKQDLFCWCEECLYVHVEGQRFQHSL
jgi:hypothetical protein